MINITVEFFFLQDSEIVLLQFIITLSMHHYIVLDTKETPKVNIVSKVQKKEIHFAVREFFIVNLLYCLKSFGN